MNRRVTEWPIRPIKIEDEGLENFKAGTTLGLFFGIFISAILALIYSWLTSV